MSPPCESAVTSEKPVTNAVDSGFLKPDTLKETVTPPGTFLLARLVTVSTELKYEHCRNAYRTAVLVEVHDMAPGR
jgi:hypothetical protein